MPQLCSIWIDKIIRKFVILTCRGMSEIPECSINLSSTFGLQHRLCESGVPDYMINQYPPLQILIDMKNYFRIIFGALS